MTPPAARDAPSTATTARTVAQAKINLFLRVRAREGTGDHQIETLFSRLELGDDAVVRTRVRGRSLDCVGDVIPPDGGIMGTLTNVKFSAVDGLFDGNPVITPGGCTIPATGTIASVTFSLGDVSCGSAAQ